MTLQDENNKNDDIYSLLADLRELLTTPRVVPMPMSTLEQRAREIAEQIALEIRTCPQGRHYADIIVPIILAALRERETGTIEASVKAFVRSSPTTQDT